MRVTIAKFMTVVVVLLNFIGIYLIWKLVSTRGKSKSNSKINLQSGSFINELGLVGVQNNVVPHQSNRDGVTIIIRSFEAFEHDIVETVKSVQNVFPDATIMVVSDDPVYPPVLLNVTNTGTSNIKFVTLKTDLSKSLNDRTPTLQVKTKYVLFIPDSTRFGYKKLLDKLVNLSAKEQGKIIAIPFKGSKKVQCLQIHLDIREWSLRFDDFPHSKECDFIKGKHALFMELENLLKLSDPFMLPFPDALYYQCVSHNVKVVLAEDLLLSNGRDLFKSQHNQWKVQQADRNRQRAMFQSLDLKKVIRETGTIEWYGCKRDTPRCFGSIIDETPQYLWEGKWTPPCCLAGLRRTARHVFEQLEEAKVRYWLEGGSLLGAMRGGDILPWDYDVDIGIYREDIPRCTWLLRATNRPVTDPHGFVWEKAVEGDFFRVQFSQVNRLHVDIFPFYSRNGTMTKDTWFKNHRQDMEFPENFLKPLSTIDFVGKAVSTPNNIHDFLELKFGEGAIETPEYPNPYKMTMHGLSRGPLS